METIKIRVLKNDKNLEEGTIINVVLPELSEDNTYYYAQDNEVNAMDKEGHICIGEEKVLCNIDDSDEHNWLFEDEYERIDMAECIYCEPHKKCNSGELHFVCEACGNGMCDDCYDCDTEHDQHYNNPLEILEESANIKAIQEACGSEEPAYICEDCLQKALGIKEGVCQ